MTTYGHVLLLATHCIFNIQQAQNARQTHKKNIQSQFISKRKKCRLEANLKSNFKKMASHNIVYFTGYPS